MRYVVPPPVNNGSTKHCTQKCNDTRNFLQLILLVNAFHNGPPCCIISIHFTDTSQFLFIKICLIFCAAKSSEEDLSEPFRCFLLLCFWRRTIKKRNASLHPSLFFLPGSCDIHGHSGSICCKGSGIRHNCFSQRRLDNRSSWMLL